MAIDFWKALRTRIVLKPKGCVPQPPPPFPCNPAQPVRSGACLSVSRHVECRISKWLKPPPKVTFQLCTTTDISILPPQDALVPIKAYTKGYGCDQTATSFFRRMPGERISEDANASQQVNLVARANSCGLQEFETHHGDRPCFPGGAIKQYIRKERVWTTG